MPAIVNPPPLWVWHHAPHSLKIFLAVATVCFVVTSVISFIQYFGMLRKGAGIKNKQGQDHIQLPTYVQRNLEIIQKPWFLSLFALMSLCIMPFGRVFDIILAVTLSVVVRDFADLCIGHLHNSDTYLVVAADQPQKWYSRPPCCFWAKCVNSEPLQLKHLKWANQCVWWYVTFIPFNAMITMIMDTAFTPPIVLDDDGYCSVASANTNPPYDPAGRLTLVTTMSGMWGVGTIAQSVDMCLGENAGANKQLSFIRMYQILGLLKPLILHYARPLTYITPTWPMAVIPNLEASLNSTATATSTVVNCPVFDYDCMSRVAFLTFTCVWMLLIAMGNRTKFTLEHEEEMVKIEEDMSNQLSKGLLKNQVPPIHMTLG